MTPTEHNIKLPDGSIERQTTTLNLGPTHPATHGVFENILELDGERIVSTKQTVGYIHRAFEKLAEHRPLYQITPLTDRLNYCSSPINNMGWHLTCEKLLNVKTPKRVDYLQSQRRSFFISVFCIGREHLTQAHEYSHNLNAGLNRPLAVENIGGHDRTVFSKDIWKIPSAAPTLRDHNL